MKTGRTITALAAELERQASAKSDFIADCRELIADQRGEGDISLAIGDERPLPVNQTAHRQLGSLTGIPAKYYDRMRSEHPDLLAASLNRWLGGMPERRMIRTMDGHVRAVLSDRYQRIDNIDVAEAILPVLSDMPGLSIASCEVTESRLYIKAVNQMVRSEVKTGDIVEAGVLITNSEIGHGAVVITPLVHRLVCLNGMTVNDARFRRNHVGSRAEIGDATYAMLTDETRAADDRAILLKCRDVVRGSMDEAIFGKTVERMRAATEGEKMIDPVAGVQRLGQRVGLQEGEQKSVLRHLIEGGDLSRYGALNAITRMAQDVESYDRSTELEAVGGSILDLPASEWRAVAEAA